MVLALFTDGNLECNQKPLLKLLSAFFAVEVKSLATYSFVALALLLPPVEGLARRIPGAHKGLLAQAGRIVRQ